MPLFPFFRGKGFFRGKRRWLLLCDKMLPVRLCWARSWASSRKMTFVVSVPEVGKHRNLFPTLMISLVVDAQHGKKNETQAAKAVRT